MLPTTLAERFDSWRQDRRAVPWTVRYRFALGRGSRERTFRFFAPADATGAEAVICRLHNGCLFLQPLSVVLDAPVPEAVLEPLLGGIRRVHAVPIRLEGDDPTDPGPGEARDLPARQEQPGGVRAGLAVGLDIGTNIKACALVDGGVVRTAQGPTWPGDSRGVGSLVERSRALVSEVCAGQGARSLGIGLASPMGVQGQVVGLSTVMRERLGSVEALEALPDLVAQGLVDGPVVIYNDLANLGRALSGEGLRRYLRVQIGTSFGGCWIDADGTVSASELGRLVVDIGPGARPHTYLPLRGAMKAYLSNYGVARTLSERTGRPVSPAQAGFAWRDLHRAGDPVAMQLVEWTAALLVGAIREALAVLPGLETAELGGGMIQGPTGPHLGRAVARRLAALRQGPRFQIARDPAFDGAVAAARAPVLEAPLRGFQRLVG